MLDETPKPNILDREAGAFDGRAPDQELRAAIDAREATVDAVVNREAGMQDYIDAARRVVELKERKGFDQPPALLSEQELKILHDRSDTFGAGSTQT